jgi:hypothetical protein
MSTKLISWLAFALLIAQAANAGEVARWDFEETSGGTAADQSGQYVANLEGGDSLDVEGRFGSGIYFAGDGGATMDAASSEILRFTEDFSIVLWINSDVPVADYTRFVDMSAADGGLADSYRLMTGSGGSSDNFRFMSEQPDGSNTSRLHTRDLVADTWTLLALRHDLDGEVTLNVIEENDPVDAAFVGGNSESWPTLGPIVYAEGDLKIGRLIGGGRKFEGQMDGVAFYDHLLTDAEIATIFNKPPSAGEIAASPLPDDGIGDVLRNVVLTWAQGDFAQSHDVYLGSAYEDVNNANLADPLGVLLSEGQTTNSLDVGVLEFGQTYYWRVDEVNGAPDNTVFKGDVWSFQVEPFSLPITGIAATASSTHDETMTAAKTIDGSGLTEMDQHSAEGTDMWLSGMGDPTPSIQYEFNRAYKLHEMWVWNSNQLIEGFVGLGAKEVSVEVSTDSVDWTLLDTPDFAQAPGKEGYAHNTVIDLGGAIAKYVKLTINSGYGMLPQSGLSELRFFYVPTQAREPQPADNATEVAVDTILTWRSGREAASHQVSVGTDPNAVAQGTDAADTTDASFDPGALNLASTYYWQVDEVNETETPAAHTGATWSFSTQEYLVVDNFEGYDDNCDRIFFAWEDGLGHSGSEGIEGCSVSPSNGNGGGSIVGHAQAPFAERSIVHSGSQSMPLAYDNAFGPSEAMLRLDSQDWTAHGIVSLGLFFRGDPANTGQLYLKINDTKITYSGLPGALQRAQWLPWNIDLSTVGGNLQSVTSLTIGIDGATASGMLNVDDILLYPLAPELITPVEPDPANLLSYYAFDGDAGDSVGGLHGTLVGNASFVTGQQGQAISLNTITVTDYVDILGYQGLSGAPAITVAAWVKTDADATGAIIGWGPNVAGQRFGFRIDAGRLRTEHAGGNIQGDSPVNDGTWHHVAVTVQANSTISYPAVQLWLDGLDDTRPTTDPDAYDLTADLDVSIGRRPASDDRYFIGEIDELYIYDRALSAAEIAGLAGLTQPFDKAFDSE